LHELHLLYEKLTKKNRLAGREAARESEKSAEKRPLAKVVFLILIVQQINAC